MARPEEDPEHQKRNAEAMVVAGAAVMLEEPELELPGKLLDALVALLMAPERLARMGAAARTQAHPNAAERIAERLAGLAGRDGEAENAGPSTRAARSG